MNSWKGTGRAGQRGHHGQELPRSSSASQVCKRFQERFPSPKEWVMVGKEGSAPLAFWPMVTSIVPLVEEQPDVTLGMWLLDAEPFLVLM